MDVEGQQNPAASIFAPSTASTASTAAVRQQERLQAVLSHSRNTAQLQVCRSSNSLKGVLSQPLLSHTLTTTPPASVRQCYHTPWFITSSPCPLRPALFTRARRHKIPHTPQSTTPSIYFVNSKMLPPEFVGLCRIL